MKNYKVYLIKDFNDTTVYVGLTGQALSRRFSQHVSDKQLNKNHYRIELVQENLSLDQAVILEEMLIIQYDTRANGFNVSPKSINGYSNEHSPEMKAKWSAERKNKKVSEQHAAKNRIARLGQKNSEAHKEAVRQKLSRPVMCLETGRIYKSMREAADKLNLSYSKLSLVCNGKRTKTGGLHFKFV